MPHLNIFTKQAGTSLNGKNAQMPEEVKGFLDEANATSEPARTAWLAFLALLTYVTLASVSHKDLLLNSPVRLPIINADIPLVGFFQYAPAMLLAALLVQHVVGAEISQVHRRDRRLSDPNAQRAPCPRIGAFLRVLADVGRPPAQSHHQGDDAVDRLCDLRRAPDRHAALFPNQVPCPITRSGSPTGIASQ